MNADKKFKEELDEFVKKEIEDDTTISLDLGDDVGGFGRGADLVEITDEDVTKLKEGKILGFYDGEYTHFFIYMNKKKENQKY